MQRMWQDDGEAYYRQPLHELFGVLAMTAPTTPAGATEQEQLRKQIRAILSVDWSDDDRRFYALMALVTRYSEQHEAAAVLDGKIEELENLPIYAYPTEDNVDRQAVPAHMLNDRLATLTKQKAAMQQEEK